MTNVAYTLHFPGPPIPLARPRFSRNKVYDPQKALKKTIIKYLIQQQDRWNKINGPIGILIEFRMPIPRYNSKKKQRELTNSYHTKRPDLSNLIKFIEDAMQGYVYDDDSQIVEITARKINALIPETIVQIWSQNDCIQDDRKTTG